MTRTDSIASAAVRHARWPSVRPMALLAGRTSLDADVKDRVDMNVFSFERSAGRRSCGERLESVALEDRESLRRTDERQPDPRRLRMRRTLHLRAGIDRGCVLRGWDVDMGDRIADLLL